MYKTIIEVLDAYDSGKITRADLVDEIVEMSPSRKGIRDSLKPYILQIIAHYALIASNLGSPDTNHWKSEINDLTWKVRALNRKGGVTDKDYIADLDKHETYLGKYSLSEIWLWKKEPEGGIDGIISDYLETSFLIKEKMEEHQEAGKTPLILKVPGHWKSPEDIMVEDLPPIWDLIYPELKNKGGYK